MTGLAYFRVINYAYYSIIYRIKAAVNFSGNQLNLRNKTDLCWFFRFALTRLRIINSLVVFNTIYVEALYWTKRKGEPTNT